jgi:hypothetical protein
MPLIRPFRASFGRSLAQRLDRLGGTLSDLRDRLRESVAHAVGTAVADAVRSVTSALLSGVKEVPPRSPSWSPSTPRSFWHDSDDRRYDDRYADFDADDEYDERPDAQPPPSAANQSRIQNALALGCEGAAWWLRRSLSGRYVLATLAVGLLCAAAAYLVGERLAGTILNLAALADVVRSGTALLTGVGTS